MVQKLAEIPPEAKGCLRAATIILFFVALGATYWVNGSIDVVAAFKNASGFHLVVISVVWIIFGFFALQVIGVYFGLSTDPRVRVGTAIVILLTLVFGVSYAVSGSLNPLEAFEKASTFEIIVLSILCVFAVFAAIQFLFLVLLIRKIESDTGRAFDDVYCKFCDGKILGSGQILKPSLKCPHCSTWVHAACWKKNGGTITEYCPQCAQRNSPSNDLEEFLDKYRRL